MPCCKLCSKKTNCNLFNVVYNNGNNSLCQLYNIPTINVHFNKLFSSIKTTSSKVTIGFTNNALDLGNEYIN